MTERNIKIIAKKYLRGSAIFDIFANGPILVYLAWFGLPSTEDEI